MILPRRKMPRIDRRSRCDDDVTPPAALRRLNREIIFDDNRLVHFVYAFFQRDCVAGSCAWLQRAQSYIRECPFGAEKVRAWARYCSSCEVARRGATCFRHQIRERFPHHRQLWALPDLA